MALIALDFDGVLHATGGAHWDADVPTGPPVDGALDAVRWMLGQGHKLIIFSARITIGGWPAAAGIGTWLEKWGFPEMEAVGFKPAGAKLFVDDRGLRFNGSWAEVVSFLTEHPEPGRWEHRSSLGR